MRFLSRRRRRRASTAWLALRTLQKAAWLAAWPRGPLPARRESVPPAFATREQAGYVWMYAQPDSEPAQPLPAFPHLGERGYQTARYAQRFDATLLSTAENILDVPHTAFLHRGLFRGGSAHRITAVV